MAEAVQVEVRRSGRRFDADAQLDLDADAATVWATITDYEALPRFMPGIRACSVIERRALPGRRERLVVEQRGEFRFLAFAQTMNVLLQVEHQIARVAVARAVEFDLGFLGRRGIEVFEGRYEIVSATIKRGGPRVRLRYAAVIGLALPPPPGVGSFAVRKNLTAQLDALVREVGRRSG